MLRENKKNSKLRRRRKELRRPSKRESNKKLNKRKEIDLTDKRIGREPTKKLRTSTTKFKMLKKKLNKREKNKRRLLMVRNSKSSTLRSDKFKIRLKRP